MGTATLDRLERTTFLVRAGVVLSAFAVFLGFPGLVFYPIVLWPTLGIAAVYAIVGIVATRHLRIRTLQVVLTACDAGLTLLLIAATGGSNSLAVVILFLITITVVRRFGMKGGSAPMVVILGVFSAVALVVPSPATGLLAGRGLSLGWWDVYLIFAFVLAGTLAEMERTEREMRVALQEEASRAAFRQSLDDYVATERQDTVRSILHDLASPLSSVLALSRHLNDLLDRSSNADDVQRRTVHLIYQNAMYLADMMDMLRRSAMSANAMGAFAHTQAQVVQLSELVEGAVATARKAAPVSTSVIPAESMVIVDPTVLNRLIRNLVENAVRYNPPECPPVTVEVTLTGATLRVVVHDHGPGLAAGEEQIAIRKGTRLHGEPAGDHGLGLWIVDQLVTHCGGKLSLSTPATGGLMATFEVPVELPRT